MWACQLLVSMPVRDILNTFPNLLFEFCCFILICYATDRHLKFSEILKCNIKSL